MAILFRKTFHAKLKISELFLFFRGIKSRIFPKKTPKTPPKKESWAYHFYMDMTGDIISSYRQHQTTGEWLSHLLPALPRQPCSSRH